MQVVIVGDYVAAGISKWINQNVRCWIGIAIGVMVSGVLFWRGAKEFVRTRQIRAQRVLLLFYRSRNADLRYGTELWGA